jgi:hypothetical protein
LLGVFLGIVPGAVTAYITALIYFRTKAYLKAAAGYKAILYTAIAGAVTGAAVTFAAKQFWLSLGNTLIFHYYFEMTGALCGSLFAAMIVAFYLKLKTAYYLNPETHGDQQ